MNDEISKLGDDSETREHSASPLCEPLLPVKIGRYELVKQLGAGGFGSVFLAKDPSLKRNVAIKLPRWDKSLRQSEVDRFLHEGQMLAQANHPAIVSVFDVSMTEDNVPFVVMEYVEGKSLSKLLKEEWPDQDQALDLLLAMGEGLLEAHKRGLVHRDFKPANVIISDDRQQICLVDFGLALHEDLVPQLVHSPDGIAGTPKFMAPEQIRGENHLIDGQTDIWAFGVTMYLLLTRRLPFRQSDFRPLSRAICYHNPRPLRQIEPSIPKPLERICLRCLRKLMDERYQSMADLLDELKDYRSDCVESTVQANRSEIPPDAKISTDSRSGSSDSKSSQGRHSASHPSDSQSSASSRGAIQIVPKGLRAFDQNDREFFISLLPGPRDRHGNPDSIRFWLSRLGVQDQVDDVPVGLIYGPSGCGKSSFVRAGLIPLLPDRVVPVYVDCTTEELPAYIVARIHQEINDVPIDAGLAETIRRIRLGDYVRGEDKLLLVLDQFEQWLTSSTDYAENELTEALRQCDSSRVQVLLLIRDEFWINASEFLKCLQCRIEESHNAMSLPLFDLRHARHVLEAMGRAYEVLPPSEQSLTRNQKRFIRAAVQSLAERDRVICVHLAVFAETVRNRPWNFSELKTMGGWEGIGRQYIADIFNTPETPAYIKRHSSDAWKILKPLLPESNVQWKGGSLTRAELLVASGMDQQRPVFSELFDYLEKDAKLISSVSPESDDSSSGSAPKQELKYGLTHDFLVTPIRDWGLAKQNETARGRADSQLQRLAAQWRLTRDDRFLMSTREFIRTRWLSSLQVRREHPEYWSRVSVRASNRLILTACLAVYLVVGVVFASGVLRRIQDRRALVRYLTCPAGEIAEHREELRPNASMIDEIILRQFESTSAPRRVRVRALALACLEDVDPGWLMQIFDDLENLPADESANLVELLRDSDVDFTPIIPNRDRTGTPIQQARMAITAGHLGEIYILTDLMKLRADPAMRRIAMEQLAEWNPSWSELLMIPSVEASEADLLSGLCSAASLLEPSRVSAVDRKAIVQFARQVFCDSPHAGAHAAARHLLDRWEIELPMEVELAPKDRDWIELSIENTRNPAQPHRLLMVRIPAGSFDPAAGLRDGETLRGMDFRTGTVEHPFWISAHEISADLFHEFHQPETHVGEDSSSETDSVESSGAHQMPIGEVTHNECLEFCRWLESVKLKPALARLGAATEDFRLGATISLNLPTLDQFEIANRAKSESTFFFGNDVLLLAKFAGYGRERDYRRGQFMPNGLGVSDTVGNYEEWVREVDTKGFAFCRGGADEQSFSYLRSGACVEYPADTTFSRRGFRVVIEKK